MDGPFFFSFTGASAGAAIFLLLRGGVHRWWLNVIIAGAVGCVAAVTVLLLTDVVFHPFRIPLGLHTWVWLIVVGGGVGVALANFRSSSRLRKWGASACIVLFVVTGALGINAGFGMFRTVSSILGKSAEEPITLPSLNSPAPGARPILTPGQLWKGWVAPTGIAVVGITGTQVIPNTASGFVARSAGIYLPPAALVSGAPALPLVIMLMGQPGSPDPSYVAHALDQLAARNGGLAPIVVVADQLGDPGFDPLCLDSTTFGNAETYITQDVLGWARKNLNVTQDPASTTIAGYSNGGECAIALAAKHPDLWSNIIDISGEEFPGSERPDATLNDIFAGDQAAYDAQMPVNILASKRFPNAFAVFTVGSNDAGYILGVQKVAAAASAAGMNVTYCETPDGGHVIPALPDGLTKAFALLLPHLGLAPHDSE